MGEKHDKKSNLRYKIHKVGITNLRLPIKIKREDVDIMIIPKITACIDFDSDSSGIHMSRIQTSIIETINTASSVNYIEDLGYRILKNISEKMNYSEGEIIFEFPYALRTKTLKSGYEIKEVHDVKIKVNKLKDKFYKTITCKVVGNSVCKCEGHMQRAYITISITTDLNTCVLFRDLVDAANNSFSCPVTSIVRTEDEKEMAKKMRENPKFVEDLVREAFHNTLQVCKHKKIKGVIEVEALSEDSIHRHDPFAKITKQIK